MQENKKEQTTGTKTPKLGQESGFQAYRLYNAKIVVPVGMSFEMFQSSFELTGYITERFNYGRDKVWEFQSSFELTGYITRITNEAITAGTRFQSSFELTGYITKTLIS